MAPSSNSSELPVHDLHAGRSAALYIRAISHRNEYDFTQKHRHSYFEILFFEKGGGVQLIDFQEFAVQDHSCYIVHPNQIHLLDRSPDSRGRLIQFRTESVISSKALIQLRERMWDGVGAIVFENDPTTFNRFGLLLDQFRAEDASSKESTERDLHLLQVLLFDLLSNRASDTRTAQVDADFNRFLQLVDAHFREQHSVQFYLNELNISEKKLGALTKQHLGASPLQAIHQRLVLEVKRMLLFGQESHKEIAYSLGFDSPASFSAFVKKRTGQTPSELQTSVEGIQK